MTQELAVTKLWHMFELLTPEQMSTADQLTIAEGIPGLQLMDAAGCAVATSVINSSFAADNIVVVCGTGNNGGDGFVSASELIKLGKRVAVYIYGDVARISGDAKHAFGRLEASTIVSALPDFSTYDVIIDALLGAGLDRPVEGEMETLITAINDSKTPVFSVDLPSGIDGATGRVMGTAVEAAATTTFFRYKPGHVLMPGRKHCGAKSLFQIGITGNVLKKCGFSALLNSPDIWKHCYPLPSLESHKYKRGHTLVISGTQHATGAARLAAQSALRTGSGLVTVASPSETVSVNASHLTSVMLCVADSAADIGNILEDDRINCVLLGPGLPADAATRKLVEKVLEFELRVVLDAGALSAFDGHESELFALIQDSRSEVFLTPHDGEFSGIFPAENEIVSKIERGIAAAKASHATVLLKGSDTVVATHEAEVSVAENATPWLATAGSGDVLAGMVAGLAAQGMPSFEAASAAVWLHGDAAARIGPGLISSDLDEGLRSSIRELVNSV